MARFVNQRSKKLLPCFLVLTVNILLVPQSGSTQSEATWTREEEPIIEQVDGLRDLPDEQRAGVTRQLALRIRRLQPGDHKVSLAYTLATLSTEGNFGNDTLQDVTTTLEQALHEHPMAGKASDPAAPYVELAELVRYEHMQALLDDPQFSGAISRMEAADRARQKADFALPDLQGRKWSLKDLHGKVVLINFWATWCPPCLKEMPSLEQLYERFKDQGLVILAISDEDASLLRSFIAETGAGFPVLVDQGRRVNDLFQIDGIPKSFVYDRKGVLVAQSIDERTEEQFLKMLGVAGLGN